MPGKPTRAQQWQAPHDVVDFQKLYAENCLGCHGAQGVISGCHRAWTIPCILPLFPAKPLRTIIANGVAGHGNDRLLGGAWRPAHRKSRSTSLVEGISAWAKNPPAGHCRPTVVPLGNAGQGATAFATYCASCHGADGNGAKAGSVVHPAYVGLVSDQYLRTIVIAGRNDLGCPDFQSRVPGKRDVGRGNFRRCRLAGVP